MKNRLDNKPTCPHCSKTLDGFGSVDKEDAKPIPGDVTLCLYCGEFLEFDKDMELIPISEEAIAHVDLKAIQCASLIRQRVLDIKDET